MPRNRPRAVITASLRTAVLARYAAGESAVSITRSEGISKTAVLGILHAGGAKVRYPRLTPDECAEICALFRAGVAQVDIAKKFERDPGNIWHVLRRAGVL